MGGFMRVLEFNRLFRSSLTPMCSAFALSAAGLAQAAPITYTISGLETGRVSVGFSQTNFANQLVTMTLTGDTDSFGAGSFGAGSIDLISGTVAVAGFGVGVIDFSSSHMVFYSGANNQGSGTAGFGVFPNGNSFDIISTFFETYDGVSTTGPIVGTNHPFSFFGAQIITSIGRVQIRDPGTPTTLTFRATVPEPTSLALTMAALLGLAGGAVARRSRFTPT
jgi:hypothetical protein